AVHPERGRPIQAACEAGAVARSLFEYARFGNETQTNVGASGGCDMARRIKIQAFAQPSQSVLLLSFHAAGFFSGSLIRGRRRLRGGASGEGNFSYRCRASVFTAEIVEAGGIDANAIVMRRLELDRQDAG